MDAIKKEFVNVIIAILTDLMPGGKYVRDTVQTAAVSILSRRDKGVIIRAANRIFDQLYESVGLDAENPGAAASAAYNVLDSVKKANLSPEIIVDCCLDAKLLFEYVMQFPANGIESASSIRKTLYQQGLQAFCSELVANALEIQSVQLFVYRKILHDQRRVLDMLGELKLKEEA